MELQPRGVAQGDDAGVDLAEHPGERAAGGGARARDHQVGAVVHGHRPGRRPGRELCCHPRPQVGGPVLDPPGAGRRIQDGRPALAQRAHGGLDDRWRLAEQCFVDEKPEVGERHGAGAEGSGSLPVGLVEMPLVERAALRGEPPGAVEHQRQRRADAVHGVRAQPHGVAAQALLVGEGAAGVELACPPGGRNARQPGERRLQARHRRGHPIRVAAGGGQLVPGGGQLIKGLFGGPADAVVGNPGQDRPQGALGPDVLRGHVDLPGQPVAVGQPLHQREDFRGSTEPGERIGEHDGRDRARVPDAVARPQDRRLGGRQRHRRCQRQAQQRAVEAHERHSPRHQPGSQRGEVVGHDRAHRPALQVGDAAGQDAFRRGMRDPDAAAIVEL